MCVNQVRFVSRSVHFRVLRCAVGRSVYFAAGARASDVVALRGGRSVGVGRQGVLGPRVENCRRLASSSSSQQYGDRETGPASGAARSGRRGRLARARARTIDIGEKRRRARKRRRLARPATQLRAVRHVSPPSPPYYDDHDQDAWACVHGYPCVCGFLPSTHPPTRYDTHPSHPFLRPPSGTYATTRRGASRALPHIHIRIIIIQCTIASLAAGVRSSASRAHGAINFFVRETNIQISRTSYPNPYIFFARRTPKTRTSRH